MTPDVDVSMRILAVGHNVRQIATSASRAGHIVLAADCYCDQDLVDAVSEAKRLGCDPSVPNDLARAAREVVQDALDSFSPDAVVLGSGLEDLVVKGVEVLNNPAQKVAQVSDKLWLARWLERRGYPTISTALPEDKDKLEGWPLMVKPRTGAGGWKNRLIWDDEDEDLGGDLVVQEWVEGKTASVSVLGDGCQALAVAVNEQMIGTPWLGARGFRYCGNLTPFYGSETAEMAEMGEEIVAELGLVGSNGIDFLATDRGPVVVEVNPRIQGSLDSVELSTGMSIFQAHLLSFRGDLPERPVHYRRAAGRAILFADRDLITGDLCGDWVADVPRAGSIFRRDEPVVSILAAGKNGQDVMDLLRRRSVTMRQGFRDA
ncbi:MAG: ATP-grasp domain-containing protein [Methanotrichaceae archaeon]